MAMILDLEAHSLGDLRFGVYILGGYTLRVKSLCPLILDLGLSTMGIQESRPSDLGSGSELTWGPNSRVYTLGVYNFGV